MPQYFCHSITILVGYRLGYGANMAHLICHYIQLLMHLHLLAAYLLTVSLSIGSCVQHPLAAGKIPCLKVVTPPAVL
jgi:hypothetical protein